MKKFMTILAMCCAFIAFTNSSNAQTSSKSGNYSLTIDPIDLLVTKVLNATFEAKIDNKTSFTIFGSYYNYNEWWSAFGIGGSYRWYFDIFNEGKKGLNGFSFGPMAKASFWSVSGVQGDAFDGGLLISIGGEAAYKWIFDNGFTIEPIVRLGIGLTDIDGLNYDSYGFGVNIGYTWK